MTSMISSEAQRVGARMRDARKAKGLKLRDLSEATGLSVPHLSKLENGKARLNVDLALELCVVLGVPAAHFFMANTPRQRHRRSITRSGEGLLHPSEGISFEVLCSDLNDKHALHWRVEVHTDAGEHTGFRSHAGEEFIHVLSGELTLLTESYEPLRLRPGDSVTFDGEMSHAYMAAGGEPAVLLMSNEIPTGSALATIIDGAGHDDSI